VQAVRRTRVFELDWRTSAEGIFAKDGMHLLLREERHGTDRTIWSEPSHDEDPEPPGGGSFTDGIDVKVHQKSRLYLDVDFTFAKKGQDPRCVARTRSV
jgi:hypothetical protein